MNHRSAQARVLAVDDDPGVLHAVKRILDQHYELICASSPAEALTVAPRFRPDLAILDIRMPGMNGFELMQKLRAAQPDLDIIFVTGSVTDPDGHLIRAIQQGAFYFVQKPFDRQVLQTLVERCLELRALRSVADRELTGLRVAQSRLLPQVPPRHPEYRIAFRYRPFYFATGDYHDFFPQSDGTLSVFLGDSCGHGPSACMLMATMRTLLYTQPELHGDPGKALSSLTRMFHALIPSDLFMTAIYLRLGHDGCVEWAAAGQQPPIRITPAGVAAADPQVGGLPLGISPDYRYPTAMCRLRPGERLFAFTDGIVEARDRQGKMLGLKGVKDRLEELSEGALTSEAILDALVEEVKSFMEGSDFDDDFTVLALERKTDQAAS
jgi:sigma-B regulation protein RsbU (phosphoserine phosphatase)